MKSRPQLLFLSLLFLITNAQRQNCDPLKCVFGFGIGLAVIIAFIIAVPISILAAIKIYKFLQFYRLLLGARSRQKQKRDFVNHGIMREEDFQTRVKQFQQKEWFIEIKQEGRILFTIEISSIKMRRVQPYLYEIKMKGRHEYSKWEGRGSFMAGQNGTEFWLVQWAKFRKTHTNDNLGKLVYEFSEKQSGKFQGNWICVEEQNTTVKGQITMLLEQNKGMALDTGDINLHILEQTTTQKFK